MNSEPLRTILGIIVFVLITTVIAVAMQVLTRSEIRAAFVRQQGGRM